MGARFDTIRTERLVMRRWREADREPYAALNADPVVMRYFPATYDRTASDGHVDRMEKLFERQGFGLWALELADTGQFLGFTGLNPMPDGLAPRVCDGGGLGRAGRGLRRDRARGSLVDDGGAQRAVAGGHEATRHERAQLFRASPGGGRAPVAAARGLPEAEPGRDRVISV
jgi:hypothetical protein